jgi:hypothetical protein
MNSDDVAANSDKMMHDHVLEVELEEGRLLVKGFYEMVTEGVKI